MRFRDRNALAIEADKWMDANTGRSTLNVITFLYLKGVLQVEDSAAEKFLMELTESAVKFPGETQQANLSYMGTPLVLECRTIGAKGT